MPVDTKPPRPMALPVSPQSIPEVLRRLSQWVVWQYRWIPERQQWTKPPSQISGHEAKSNTPSTWTSFERAYESYHKGAWDGVGFVMQEGQGLVGIDLDHCRDAESGDIEAAALAMVRAIDSYTEVSPSGHGLRIFAYGILPPEGRKRGGIEMYQGVRYLTLTGTHVSETPMTIESRPDAILTLHRQVFVKSPNASTPLPSRTPTRLADDEVVSRALAAKNAGKVARLWQGELAGYASQSEADLALCSMLAFWTQDAAQLDRLFRRSGLFREKWDTKRGETTWGVETITRALTRSEVWRGMAPKPPPTSPAERPAGIMGVEDLVDERVIWVASVEEKALVQAAGYRCCLALPEIPPAGSDYRATLIYLKPLEKSMVKVKQHVLLLPNTIDGRALTDELARRLGPEYCRIPVWPSECESLEHISRVHGQEMVQEVIERTKALPLEGVVEFNMLRQRLHDMYRSGRAPQGLSPGWPSLAEIYRVREGLITLILGQSGIGKSTFTAAMMVHIAQLHGWPLAIFSPEQAPVEDYAKTLIQQWAGAPFYEGLTPRLTLEGLDRSIDSLQEYITLLWPEDEEPSIDYLLTLARKEVFRRGIKGFVIDPWSEVDHSAMDQYKREDLYIQAMLTKIRKFSRTYKVHIWIAVHPPTLDGETDPDTGTKKYPVPTLPSGGQKWRDKVDNLLALQREDKSLWVHTLKTRFSGYDGIPGRKTRLYFHEASGTFSDVWQMGEVGGQ